MDANAYSADGSATSISFQASLSGTISLESGDQELRAFEQARQEKLDWRCLQLRRDRNAWALLSHRF
jgi:hypothetical protein